MLRIFPVAVGIVALGALAACSDTMAGPSGYSSAHTTTTLPVPLACSTQASPADQQACARNIPDLHGEG